METALACRPPSQIPTPPDIADTETAHSRRDDNTVFLQLNPTGVAERRLVMGRLALWTLAICSRLD